ncbi:MAG: DsbA family protein [Pseudobdellovibrionaceae bacterium]|nr:DsbA family protein [Pseudobdellovibrionaceae bacterium]
MAKSKLWWLSLGEAGLDPARARTVLESTEYSDAVRRDEEEAQNFGLTGVPAFVFNQKYLISGAQPSEVFAQALEKLLNEPA